jgi:hypothetical protein
MNEKKHFMKQDFVLRQLQSLYCQFQNSLVIFVNKMPNIHSSQ